MSRNCLLRLLLISLYTTYLEGATFSESYALSDFSGTFRLFLINGILFFLGMSLLAISIIIIHKIIIEMRTERFESLKNRYRQEMTELLFNPDTHNLSTVSHPLEFKAASDIAIELMDTFNDPLYITILHQYLDTHHIRKHYFSLASRADSLQRLDAVERLAMFRYDQNRPFFVDILSNQKNSDNILISALIGLSYVFHPEDQNIFLSTIKLIDTSGKFSEFLFFNAIEQLLATNREDTIHSIYKSLLIHANYLSVKAFIEALSDTAYSPFAQKLRKLYLSTRRDDIKISIIRALGILTENETDCTIFLDALKSDNMILRIVASKSIAICRSEEITAPASLYLYDESYRVRYNIARSLLRLPNGVIQLKNIVATSSDRYAIQSAVYALRLLETSHA